jgi:DNA-binding response OmpR family regulator
MKRVLIVDDVPEIRRLVRLCIHRRHTVMEAATAEVALAVAAWGPLDLVVLDIGLPGPMDGLDLLGALRSNPATAPAHVVILSGRGLRGETLGLPIDDFMTKPFNPSDLAASISAILDADAITSG